MATNVATKFGTSLTLRQKIWNTVSAWMIRNSGYQKLGLRREDLYDEGLSEVKEAVRRLPENEKNLRLYRLKRAVDLDLKKNILPKEQWTKPEEDVPYLLPYLEEVMKGMEERKKWNTQ